MNILVTGGAGFIGSWLVESLLNSRHAVTVLDSLSTQVHGAVPTLGYSWLTPDSGVTFIRADVRDQSAVDNALKDVQAVVHLAAETGTGQSMYKISHYYDVNQQATAALLEAIVTKHRHIRRVILASSRSIYGEGAYRLGSRVIVPGPRSLENMKSGRFEPTGPDGEALALIPTPENVNPFPASIYAATKLANEVLGRLIADAYGLTVVALRFQNVYGERQSLKNPYTGILSIFSNRMRQGLPINIFEDGLETRDFVHVRDVVSAISTALHADVPTFTALNVGSGRATTILEIAKLLGKLLGSNSKLQVSGDFRLGDIRHCYADLELAKSLLGFTPQISLVDGLQAFCDWVQTQPIAADRSAAALGELAQAGLAPTENFQDSVPR